MKPRSIITIIFIVIAVPLLAAYVGLIADGSVRPPNLELIARSFQTGTLTAAQAFLVIVTLLIGLMAAIASIIYALRSNDLLTVAISLAMTGTAIVLIAISRTAFDQIIALIIYLANITLSSAVYAAHRIAPKA